MKNWIFKKVMVTENALKSTLQLFFSFILRGILLEPYFQPPAKNANFLSGHNAAAVAHMGSSIILSCNLNRCKCVTRNAFLSQLNASARSIHRMHNWLHAHNTT
jgi:hypothetical protein